MDQVSKKKLLGNFTGPHIDEDSRTFSSSASVEDDGLFS